MLRDMYDSEVGHLPFLWPICIMGAALINLSEKTENIFLQVCIVVFGMFPAVIIWGIMAMPLIFLTPFYWLVLAAIAEIRRRRGER